MLIGGGTGTSSNILGGEATNEKKTLFLRCCGAGRAFCGQAAIKQ
jgi:RNA-splicing ligase RtcB